MPLQVRPYRPEDNPHVLRIFTAGMSELVRPWVKTIALSPRHHLLAVLVGAVVAAVLATLKLLSIPILVLLVPCADAGLLAVRYLMAKRAISSYITSSINDDLSRIPEVYQGSDGSAFWVAEAAGPDLGPAPVVAGCVALQVKSKTSGELRRMSVHTRFRRAGVGRMLASALIQHAATTGLQEVFLHTSSMQQPAMRLYERLGWREAGQPVKYGDLCIHKFVLQLPGNNTAPGATNPPAAAASS